MLKDRVKIGLFVALFLVICVSLRSNHAMAYTEEQKAQAKAWLSSHGYSADYSGAMKAYQDYKAGKYNSKGEEVTASQEKKEKSATKKNKKKSVRLDQKKKEKSDQKDNQQNNQQNVVSDGFEEEKTDGDASLGKNQQEELRESASAGNQKMESSDNENGKSDSSSAAAVLDGEKQKNLEKSESFRKEKKENVFNQFFRKCEKHSGVLIVVVVVAFFVIATVMYQIRQKNRNFR